MGTFRRMVRALLGVASPKPEDIVFEPIDGPDVRPSLPAVRKMVGEAELAIVTDRPAIDRVAIDRVAAHKVSLGDLMERVPSSWKRAVEWAPEELIELPAAARFHVGAERPLAFSLRYLVRLRPDLFRDPGIRHKDVGVDLAMEPFRDTEQTLTELPAEIVSEVEEELATFAQWELEEQSKRARVKEERETVKALRDVSLPKVQGAEETRFEVLLKDDSGERATVKPATAFEPIRQGPAPANGRLRRILEAYAEGVSSSFKPRLDPVSPPQLNVVEKTEENFHGSSARPSQGPSLAKPEWSVSGLETGIFGSATSQNSSPDMLGTQPARPLITRQMRFDELGLSLSRFPEVKGFALWIGEQAMQTGELGFDTQNVKARFKMEKILESALLNQGVQDGFLSVTVHHARGGVSIFGGGACLVAVAHQEEGMPSHLRSWLCGWVSQPIRG